MYIIYSICNAKFTSLKCLYAKVSNKQAINFKLGLGLYKFDTSLDSNLVSLNGLKRIYSATSSDNILLLIMYNNY